MTTTDELFTLADRLEALGKVSKDSEFDSPLKSLKNAAEKVGEAWSGSWLGYHSRVYYAELGVPPPGARFSQEWGLGDRFVQETLGDWREYSVDEVVAAIQQRAGDPDTSQQEARSHSVTEEFEEIQSQVLSLLTGVVAIRKGDDYLRDIVKKVEAMRVFRLGDFVQAIRPSGSVLSRDMTAIQAGVHTPPHLRVLASTLAIRHPFTACLGLAKCCRRVASHLNAVERSEMISERGSLPRRVGRSVFIGHGRSPLWKDLKDFIQARMRLPWDEFNRVPVAGMTNIARLLQMLDAAAIAFLIMTAEDEQTDGRQHARLNVVHEAGLFQGRLGFERAILLLEEGCEEFSNIQGLGQIRFPAGNLSAAFEDIRKVLEREGLVKDE